MPQGSSSLLGMMRSQVGADSAKNISLQPCRVSAIGYGTDVSKPSISCWMGSDAYCTTASEGCIY
jgi:hypothetical protein